MPEPVELDDAVDERDVPSLVLEAVVVEGEVVPPGLPSCLAELLDGIARDCGLSDCVGGGVGGGGGACLRSGFGEGRDWLL